MFPHNACFDFSQISTFDTEGILRLMQGDGHKPVVQLYVGSVAYNIPYCKGMYSQIEPEDRNAVVVCVMHKAFAASDRQSVKLRAGAMKSCIQVRTVSNSYSNLIEGSNHETLRHSHASHGSALSPGKP